MSKAKKMFEALGYKITTNEDIICGNEGAGKKTLPTYTKNSPYAKKNQSFYDVISFYEHKKYYCEKQISQYVISCSITVKEHQAIHQQMKELGWLD